MNKKLPKEMQKKQLLNEADKAFDLFDRVITNSYLKALQECEIVQFKDQKLANIRWYRITKIVMEKDVFFADKLSMLYVALHDRAKNIVLSLKKSNGKIDLYLGSRDYFEDKPYKSSKVLEAGLRGYLPGVRFKVDKRGLPEIKNGEKNTCVSSVSVLASLRDDKKENFVQGLEKLINASEAIPSFTAYFIAENVSESEATSMIQGFNAIQTWLSPWTERQLTVSSSHTVGVSQSLTKSFSETITKNISKTVTHSEGSNESHTKSSGYSTGDNFSLSPIVFSVSENESWQEGRADQYGKNSSDAIAIQEGEALGQQNGYQQQQGENKSNTKGVSLQITQRNCQAKRYVDLIDRQVERLQNGIPFGLWSVATYFVGPLETSVVELANIYKGCVVGVDSNLSVGAINCWKDVKKVNDILNYLNNQIHPVFDFDGVHVTPGTIVTSEELAIHLSLPQSSVPGILVREEQAFGRNVPEGISADNSIGIGKILHLGEESEDNEVRLDIASFNKHVFVTGTTGSGKSNTLYQLISGINKKGIRFLIIEPAKGEYKHVFGYREDVSVYGSNPKRTPLLHINPFEFPEEIDVYQHIDALVEVFNACWPMYAAMPQVLSHSIIEAYKSCGWDLEHSFNPNKTFPTVENVRDSLTEYIDLSPYSLETKSNYKGSLETRLQSLCDGTVGRIFKGTSIPDEELFNGNVIVDLSEVKSGETNSLIMGLLVLKLNEFRSSENKGMNQKLKHITVLEEAHNLLKRTSTNQISESSNVAGMAVEKIANSMAEMRTYGEGFIIADQSPSMLDLATIRNTNTKIIMALPEKDDRETAGKSIGLDDKHIEEISKLKTGEAIVYQSGWEEAVKAKIALYDTQKQTEALNKICHLLASSYTAIDTAINQRDFLGLLVAADIPDRQIYLIMERLDSAKMLTSDDVAYIFATIIGIKVFESAKHISDISLFNSVISGCLSYKLGLPNDKRMNVFVNMYMKGCSLKAEIPFYDGWLQSTISKN